MKPTIKYLIKMMSNLTVFNNILKKIFSYTVLVRKNLYNIFVPFKFSSFAKNINSPIMTLLSLLYLVALLFCFMWIFEYSLMDMFQIIIMFLYSFAVFMYISDKYKFSNIKFIFWLQKLVFFTLNFCFLVLICWLLYSVGVNLYISSTIFCDSGDSDNESVETSKNNNKSPKEEEVLRVTEDTKNTYSIELNTKIVDSALEKGPEIVAEGIKDIAPKLGVAAAAGKAAAETIKHTAGMPMFPRLLAVGSSALVTAAGTSLGMELGKAAAENMTKGAEIEASKSKLAAISKDEPVSPTVFDRSFINSVLEDSEIPLITMVNGLSLLNYMELSLVISIFSLLFRKILITKLTNIIIKLIQKNYKQTKI